MHKQEEYQAYVLSWQQPPLTAAEWVANVASENRELQERIGKGSKAISGNTFEDAIAKAKAFVDAS